MKKYWFVILLAIFFLATTLRLFKLDSIPPGINRDEASIGVTAYSLLTTGKDEYGRQFPLSFESFGDWKLPLYIYTTVPFIKIFGLNEIAVRLPSAMAGIFSVGALFYLSKFLFHSNAIALLSAFVLSIMPWHMHISRVESEAIVSVLLTVLGSIALLMSIKTKSLKKLTMSALFFSLTYYTYHGSHISTTLLVIGILSIYKNEIFSIKNWWVAIVTGAFTTLLILTITFGADHTKLSGISIFGDPFVVHNQIELPRQVHDHQNSPLAIAAHNRVTYAIMTIVQNYLNSYGPEFLFIKGGGNTAHNIKGYGNLHPIDALFLLMGFVWLIVSIKNKSAKFILWWLCIGAAAAAITKDAPHSNRMLMIVPAIAVTIGAGITYVFSFIPKRSIGTCIVILTLGYVFFITYYFDRYFVHFPKNEAAHWGYAYKDLSKLLQSDEYSKKRIIMTKPETSPYIYLLFYSGYRMNDYQKEATRYSISSDGFTDVSGFGRFSFRGIDWNSDPQRTNTLLVLSPDEMPEGRDSEVVSKIKLPDGVIKFIVLETSDHDE